MQDLNDPHPWTEGVRADLSLVDLVANQTIPAEAAALLWWAVERGASLVTAGGPSGAGKTTLANALLAFLPEGAGVYAVAGADDRLELPAHDGRTYVLVCELSDHPRPFYIAGEPARRVFALLKGRPGPGRHAPRRQRRRGARRAGRRGRPAPWSTSRAST